MRLARLVLLLAVAAGIAAMHTAGHPGSGGHSASWGHSASGGDGVSAVGAMAMVASCDDCLAVHGAGMALDPSNVCVAVLNTVGLLALLAALVLGIRGRLIAAGDPRGVLVPAGRGPPRHPPLGLRVADLSVLRR